MSPDEKYMTRCLQLAQLGFGQTRPNPMVGSVIVYCDRIIGEGYHQKAGEPHAEINALAKVVNKAQLRESTLYVNLEPCSHHGKTPPCSNTIVDFGLKRVVIGTPDSNEKVAGNGIRLLKEARIDVEVGILSSACHELNRRFFTWHEKRRPYVILKWAQSADGFIDHTRTTPVNRPAQISNPECMRLVHQWRSTEDAIMVGTNTAFLDNPQLNVRFWEGPNPLRVVIDQHLRLPANLHLLDQSQPTIVFNANLRKRSKNLEYIPVDFSQLIPEILLVLWEKGLQSLIVEGGTQLLKTFLDSGCWDETRIFTGTPHLTSGILAPKMEGNPISVENISGDLLRIFKNNHLNNRA